jgi:hypothetical protein
MRPTKDHAVPAPAAPLAQARMSRGALFVAALLACSHSGCVNVMVMAGKVLLGDAHVISAFEQRTGVSLSDGEQQVVFVCTAPGSAVEGFDSFAVELQDEVNLLLKSHGVAVIQSPVLQEAVNASGGGFDREAIARAVPEADYVLHADIEQFSSTEDASPDLLRGRAGGMLYAYEMHRSESRAGRPRPVQLFFQEFQCEYPAAHPVSADQTSPRVFRRRFVEHLAKAIGRTFYDVPTPEAFP